MEVATVVPADRLTGLEAWRAYRARKQAEDREEARAMGHVPKRPQEDAPEEGAE